MRLFAQLSWYFRREWQRSPRRSGPAHYHCHSATVPPQSGGLRRGWRYRTTLHRRTGDDVVGTLVLTAVVVYLLRYVWRVPLFGASYQLAVELREDFYRQLSRQHPEFYLRHRTGISSPAPLTM